MNRRMLLAGLGVSTTGFAGYSSFADNDETHIIDVDRVNSNEIDPETEEVCKFNDLSEGVQVEVERAIEENGYSTDNHPVLMGSECYHNSIYYKGEYYEFSVIVAN